MSRRPLRGTILLGLLSAVACCFAIGCGGNKGYRVSGKVTFKGLPIPSGKIYFIPDSSKGNKGPTGYADIKDGAYDTDAPGGNGSIGGPMIVKIEGIDNSGPARADPSGEITARSLFPPYEVKMDLPKEVTTKDIDVPADAVKGPPKKAGTIDP